MRCDDVIDKVVPTADAVIGLLCHGRRTLIFTFLKFKVSDKVLKESLKALFALCIEISIYFLKWSNYNLLLSTKDIDKNRGFISEVEFFYQDNIKAKATDTQNYL